MSAASVVFSASSSPAVKPAQDIASKGLTSDEARTRLEKDGPNAMPDTSAHPLHNALAKFWAPVPWLLEASIVLELLLHKYYEAAVIAALLVFNAALAYFQEGRAQVIVMITGDFLSMSLTTDRVRPSKMPNSWQIGRITIAGVIMGACFLAFSTAILAVGKFEMHLGIDALRTLCAVGIVFGSQATTYVIRGRQHLWGLRPSLILVLSSVADVLIISALALCGIAMAPLPLAVVACEFAAAIAFGLFLDVVKIPIFARLRIS